MFEPWRWRTFPNLSGLGVQCMAEAPNGLILFGAADGVWSYDGTTWVCHSQGLAGDVSSLCRGANGDVFAAGAWGISRFSRGKWSRLFPASEPQSREIRKLAVGRDGSLWAATSWGVLRYQASRWTLFTTPDQAPRLGSNQSPAVVTVEFLPEQIIAKPRTNSLLPAGRSSFTEICADQQGRIWLGTDGGEILCCDPGRLSTSNSSPADATGPWSIYNELDGVQCGRTPSILPLQDGRIWVVYGRDSGYLNEFDGTAWRASLLADAGLPGDCGNLIQTRDGAVWMSGRPVLCAYRDGRWRTYGKPAVPVPYGRNLMYQSSDGALWAAAPGTEILRVDYQTPRWVTYFDLIFQWESPAGAQWFLHRDGRIVVHETDHQTDQWTSYGVEDGLMDAPVALVGLPNGEVWAAGSHEHTAATAKFDGHKWTRFIHEELSWSVDWRAVLASSDGSVWFGAAVDSTGPEPHRAGILQYRKDQWIHHHQPGRAFQNDDDSCPATLLPATQHPEPIGKFIWLGESADGKIWAGRNLLAFNDGQKWSRFSMPTNCQMGAIETIYTTREKELWIGSYQFGALRYDGSNWIQYQGKNSLFANSVRSIVQTTDGSIWAATDRGVCRFDGRTWTTDLLPEPLVAPRDGGNLKASPSGRLWINRFAPEWMRRAWSKSPYVDTATCEFWTVCHQFQGAPPETTITTGSDHVPPPGNLAIFWSGTASWRDPEDSQLQFSFRLDNQSWSAFTSERSHSFFTLPSGQHHFEVRARDRDFNVDSTPATLDFVVLPPVWRQGWFVALILVFTGLIGAQSVRVLQEQGRLRKANHILAAEIEERERAEAMLRKLSRAVEQSPASIVITDKSGKIEYVNPKFTEVTGYTKAEVLGQNPRLLKSGGMPASQYREMWETIAAGKEWRGEFHNRKKNGELFWELASISPILDPSGVVTHYLAVKEDITERKRLEDKYRQAQKMEAFGQLAGGVAHDFNNILMVIQGNVSLLEMSSLATPEQTNAVERITRASDRAVRLTRQLLLFSRRQAVKLEDIDLNDVVLNMTRILQRLIGEHISLSAHYASGGAPVHADPGMLDQLIMNLAVNARDAMPQGGQLTIRTEAILVDEHAAQANAQARPGRFVRLSVSDTGTGIAPEHLPHLFEPFFTTKDIGKGTGLGLATVFGIVQQHSGWIEVQSQLGTGTTFHLYLPHLGHAPKPQTVLRPKPQERGGTETILLVEDEPEVRELVHKVLETHGYRVYEAPSAVAALDVWAEHRDEIDLLLTDMVMPEGMTGGELGKRLQTEDPELKVIYSTGYTDEMLGEASQLRDGPHFLEKPYVPSVVLQKVRACLDA